MINKIKEAFADIAPESQLGKIGQKMVRENQDILDRFVAGIREAADNAAYTENTTDEGGVRYSLRNTKDMTWKQQTDEYFKHNRGAIQRSDTLALNNHTYSFLVNSGIKDLPLAIPLKVVSKAQSNKDSSHLISDENIKELKKGVDEAIAVIHDPKRNSLLFITSLKQNNMPVAVSFEINTIFDGDNVHKGTSIHLRTNLTGTLENLSGATVYVKNKNELESLTKVNILDRVQENNKLIDLTVSQNDDNVKEQSRDDDYLSAVNRGDMETAQRMVDEAAERAFADSKIRGEDGKLVKVYHGTYADFTVFDKAMGRSSADIQGMFFSPWDIDAGGYGPNVRAFYLNINNPADERTGYKALNAHKGENYVGIKAREDLEKAGYDGVNNSDEEYIAFTSEQIKSADPVTYDDNSKVIPLSERFNSENKDIRYDSRDSDLLSDDDLSFGEYDDISDVIKRQYITYGEALKNTADFAIVIMMKRWYNISK